MKWLKKCWSINFKYKQTVYKNIYKIFMKYVQVDVCVMCNVMWCDWGKVRSVLCCYTAVIQVLNNTDNNTKLFQQKYKVFEKYCDKI